MRPPTDIPHLIHKPYPIKETNEIIKGFGRGSSELGIPTANIPITPKLSNLEPGIYFGYCKVIPNHKHQKPEIEVRSDGREVSFNQGQFLCESELVVLPMVMSIGFNPFYSNKEKTAEIHIIHKFKQNFYGAEIQYLVLGYIRPELDYTSKEALIEDINLDIKIALDALDLDAYKEVKKLLAP